MMLMQAGYEPIAIRHDAGSTYAGRLEQWQAYGNPVPLACMVADCVVREQCRIGKIVSDIRRGHPIAGHARGIREQCVYTLFENNTLTCQLTQRLLG